MSITQPLKYIANQSKTKARWTLVIVWLLSSVWILPINFWNFDIRIYFARGSSNNAAQSSNAYELNSQQCVTDFETNKIFKIVSTMFNFYVPLIGMLLIYFKIFQVTAPFTFARKRKRLAKM